MHTSICWKRYSYYFSGEPEDWKSAMDEEIYSLYKNSMYELVILSKGKKVIECKNGCLLKNLIFICKESNTKLSKWNIRWSGVGWWQKARLGRKELSTWAIFPIVKHSSICIWLVLVPQWDLKLVLMDVKTTVLYGKLKENIYDLARHL